VALGLRATVARSTANSIFNIEGAMLAMNEWTTRYMQTTAIDLGTAIIARAIEGISRTRQYREGSVAIKVWPRHGRRGRGIRWLRTTHKVLRGGVS
jgi:hypothetical protein